MRVEGILSGYEGQQGTSCHQRLRDEQGLTVGITSFRRYCWAEFPDERNRDKVTVARPDVEPGDEARF
jgi:hypothetical protein